MRILITGSSGFLMRAFVKQLSGAPGVQSAVLYDQTPPDPTSVDQLSVRDITVTSVCADIRDVDALSASIRDGAVDTVVHAAAITHVPEWERTRPADYFEANLMGTVAVLDALRRTSTSLRRFIAVSSCAVYGAGQRGLNPQPEAGPTVPDDLYGITKLAAEATVQRYSQLFSIPYVIARPGKLFGPTERPTSARALMSAPYQLAAAWRRGDPLRVTARTMNAALDWLSAEDAAIALKALVAGAGRDGATYNLGTGRAVPFPELAAAMEAATRSALVNVVSERDTAELDLDPAACLGKDAASDITFARSDLCWTPRAFGEQVASYIDHLRPGVEGPT